MLTRKIAIARLRATGTLAATPRTQTMIDAKQTRNPITWELNTIVAANRRTISQRWLAPADCQPVLP